MARLPRLTLPGCVHHLTQRGNNGQPIALADDDFRLLHAVLVEHSRACGVAIHAYVLLDNGFQLLATPSDRDGVPRLMQAVGRRYVRLFNDAHGRRGTLWEGRYRSTLLQPERYLLAAMVSIEASAVRAGRIDDAASYPWSSHSHHVGKCVDRLVTPHALFWRMGDTPFARELSYARLSAEGVAPAVQDALDRAALSGWPLGDEEFIAMLGQRSDRRTRPAKAGRPRKAPSP